MKQEFVALVGLFSVNKFHKILGSKEAYEVGYRKIYNAFPLDETPLHLQGIDPN
jgi:hypothetical protein